MTSTRKKATLVAVFFQNDVKFFCISEVLSFRSFFSNFIFLFTAGLFIFVCSCDSARFWLEPTSHSRNVSSYFSFSVLTIKFTDRVEIRETKTLFVAMLRLIFIKRNSQQIIQKRSTIKRNTILICFSSKYLDLLWLLEKKKCISRTTN